MKEDKNELIIREEEKQVNKNGMSIYDYENKYVKRENTRNARALSRILASVIGVFMFTCLFLIVMKLFDIHEYAGYAGIVAAIFAFIFLFIVPVVKIFKSDYFMTNIRIKDARSAKRHNRKVRRDIASKIINLSDEVDTVKWYDEILVGKLAVAYSSNDDKSIKENLTELFKDSVKKTAKSIITKSSLKSALFTAVSQKDALDVALVISIDIQMIKDIVFLYGFRPSDAKLSKIFSTVILNSLAAYGMESVPVGQTVAKGLNGVTKNIPILGSIIETVVDSTIQGLVNATFTAIIGYQTLKYLEKEYKLQDILDGIELETDEDFEETCQELKSEITSRNKKKTAHQVA